jgi:hypothetical protein
VSTLKRKLDQFSWRDRECRCLSLELASHTPAPWPSNFDESLVVGALLWKTVKRSGENYLLQLSGF